MSDGEKAGDGSILDALYGGVSEGYGGAIMWGGATLDASDLLPKKVMLPTPPPTEAFRSEPNALLAAVEQERRECARVARERGSAAVCEAILDRGHSPASFRNYRLSLEDQARRIQELEGQLAQRAGGGVNDEELAALKQRAGQVDGLVRKVAAKEQEARALKDRHQEVVTSLESQVADWRRRFQTLQAQTLGIMELFGDIKARKWSPDQLDARIDSLSQPAGLTSLLVRIKEIEAENRGRQEATAAAEARQMRWR